MLFAEAPEWIRQVLRELSRQGYIYIGRTGVGLGYAFRRGPYVAFCVSLLSIPAMDEGPLTECYNLGTIKAIDKHGEDLDLGQKCLLELIATEGPKWVPYERILEVVEAEPLLRALKEELT